MTAVLGTPPRSLEQAKIDALVKALEHSASQFDTVAAGARHWQRACQAHDLGIWQSRWLAVETHAKYQSEKCRAALDFASQPSRREK